MYHYWPILASTLSLLSTQAESPSLRSFSRPIQEAQVNVPPSLSSRSHGASWATHPEASTAVRTHQSTRRKPSRSRTRGRSSIAGSRTFSKMFSRLSAWFVNPRRNPLARLHRDAVAARLRKYGEHPTKYQLPPFPPTRLEFHRVRASRPRIGVGGAISELLIELLLRRAPVR